MRVARARYSNMVMHLNGNIQCLIEKHVFVDVIERFSCVSITITPTGEMNALQESQCCNRIRLRSMRSRPTMHACRHFSSTIWRILIELLLFASGIFVCSCYVLMLGLCCAAVSRSLNAFSDHLAAQKYLHGCNGDFLQCNRTIIAIRIDVYICKEQPTRC